MAKKSAKPSKAHCMCEEPRTANPPSSALSWGGIICQRCRLPVGVMSQKGKRHAHCWHPDMRQLNPHRLQSTDGKGEDPCVCCLCGERKTIAWHWELVRDHGQHWRVAVRVYNE